MTQHCCTCGYQADSAEDLAIHLGEMFIPIDDVGPDGQVHAEAARDKGAPAPATLACRCGFAAGTDAFDQHLIDVFTPADHIGLDGKLHEPAGPAAQQA